jgi:hypothetical protein
MDSTTVVPPGYDAEIDKYLNIIITAQGRGKGKVRA